MWNEVRDPLAESVAVVLDAATFSSVSKPGSWPDGIVTKAIAEGQTHELGASPAQGGVGADLDALFDVVEGAGRDVTGIVATRRLKSLLRASRNAQGDRLVTDVNNYFGTSVTYVAPEVLPDDVVAVAGDFSLGIVGVRSDLTWKLLDQAVLQDADGNIIYNLPQQDMVAMRLTARYAFQVAEPVTRLGSGYPFAVLTTDDSSTRAAAAAERKPPAAKK